MESIIARVPPLLFVVIAVGIGMLLYWRYDEPDSLPSAPFTPTTTAADTKRHSAADDETRSLVASLQDDYQHALADNTWVSTFLAELTRRIEAMSHPKQLAFQAADYTTKLIMARLKERDFETAKAIFMNYIDHVIPYTGLSPKSLDVASNALVIPQRDDIFVKIEQHILGEGFDIGTIEHPTLLYNLSCYYALSSDKPKMLRAIELSMQHGKRREQFLADADFDAFKSDLEFLAVLERSGGLAVPPNDR
jgi:hypothetical protein